MTATAFESARPAMLGIAYRMLGDMAAAEDVVQDAWLRFAPRSGEIVVPAAWLTTTVTRLCLDRLRARTHEPEPRAPHRLPEPVAAERDAFGVAEEVTLAFLVLLQRLSPAERAVFVLHEAFDLPHAEIAAEIGKTEAASRQLLRRARAALAAGRARHDAEDGAHDRLLDAFARASRQGDVDGLRAMLAEDVELLVDADDEARYGRVRALPRPLSGAEAVARFLAAAGRQGPDLPTRVVRANGRPALLLSDDRGPHSLLQLAVDARERITAVFLIADRSRLTRC